MVLNLAGKKTINIIWEGTDPSGFIGPGEKIVIAIKFKYKETVAFRIEKGLLRIIKAYFDRFKLMIEKRRQKELVIL